MAADKQEIINSLNYIRNENGAVVFAIGEHFVQAASALPDEIYCEAVSHHYYSGINIALESSFINMGFLLLEGGNYSRKYHAVSDADIEKIADDILKIFNELYISDHTLPFEVTEL